MTYVREMSRAGNPCLIIGQAPARTDDPRHPLSGRTGKRLADMMRIPMIDFLNGFDRANLINHWPGSAKGGGDLFDIAEAARSAVALREIVRAYRFVLLLGNGVAEAFRYDDGKFRWVTKWNGYKMAMMPHPSGISRWWNSGENRGVAGRFLQELYRECCLSSTG